MQERELSGEEVQERELSGEEVQDRSTRRRLIGNMEAHVIVHRPHMKVGKDVEEDEK